MFKVFSDEAIGTVSHTMRNYEKSLNEIAARSRVLVERNLRFRHLDDLIVDYWTQMPSKMLRGELGRLPIRLR
jgi:hypothetical protein